MQAAIPPDAPEGTSGCSTIGGADRDTVVSQRTVLMNAGFWCSEVESGVSGSPYNYQFFCCSRN